MIYFHLNILYNIIEPEGGGSNGSEGINAVDKRETYHSEEGGGEGNNKGGEYDPRKPDEDTRGASSSLAASDSVPDDLNQV